MSAPTNRGAIWLRIRLQERGERARLARDLKVGQDVVSHWLAGDRKPDAQNRAGIEDAELVPWRSWDVDVPGEGVAEAEKDIAAEVAAAEKARKESAKPAGSFSGGNPPAVGKPDAA